MKKYKVVIARGDMALGELGSPHTFIVAAKNIQWAQVRVLCKIFGITGSTLYFIKSACEVGE